MLAMRNLRVHEYFGIDDQIVWATATNIVLPLAAPLRRLHDRSKVEVAEAGLRAAGHGSDGSRRSLPAGARLPRDVPSATDR